MIDMQLLNKRILRLSKIFEYNGRGEEWQNVIEDSHILNNPFNDCIYKIPLNFQQVDIEWLLSGFGQPFVIFDKNYIDECYKLLATEFGTAFYNFAMENRPDDDDFLEIITTINSKTDIFIQWSDIRNFIDIMRILYFHYPKQYNIKNLYYKYAYGEELYYTFAKHIYNIGCIADDDNSDQEISDPTINEIKDSENFIAKISSVETNEFEEIDYSKLNEYEFRFNTMNCGSHGISVYGSDRFAQNDTTLKKLLK